MEQGAYSLVAARSELPGRPRLVGFEEAIEGRFASKGLTWIKVLCHDPVETTRTLVETFQLRPLEVEMALDPRQTADVHEHDDVLFVEIPAAMADSGGVAYHEVGMFLGRNFLLTVSSVEIPSIDRRFELWAASQVGKAETSAGILHGVLDAIVDGYFPVSDALQEELEDVEEWIFAGKQLDTRQVLRLKKRLLLFRRRIAAIRDALNVLLRRDSGLVPKALWLYYHDVYDHALRLAETTDLARDIVSSILDTQVSITSNRLNEVMRFLAAVSTILMSVTLISGIYGMNFVHMPELDKPWAYPAVLVLMAIVGSAIWYAFRRRGWV